MTITFLIPSALQSQTNGKSQVQVEASAANVAEALTALWGAYPGLRDRVLTEQGEVRQHVNLFVDEDNIRDCGRFAAPVKDGAVITIVPAVSGGWF